MSVWTRNARRASSPPGSGGRTLLVIAALYALGGCSLLPAAIRPGKPPAPPAAAESSPTAPVAATAGAGGAGGVDADHHSASGADSPPPEAPSERRRDAHGGAGTRATAAGGARTALVVADVGYYMDVLQGRLVRDVGRDARIERRGNNIVLFFPVAFDSDSARLSAAGRQLLRPLAEILNEYRLTVVEVQVRGAASDTQGLANDRAGALSRYLTDAGVAGKRVSAASVDPPESEGSAQDPLLGARVELQLSPIVAGVPRRL